MGSWHPLRSDGRRPLRKALTVARANCSDPRRSLGEAPSGVAPYAASSCSRRVVPGHRKPAMTARREDAV